MTPAPFALFHFAQKTPGERAPRAGAEPLARVSTRRALRTDVMPTQDRRETDTPQTPKNEATA